MPGYRHIDVSEVGDVTVVRFRGHRITDDIDILELGQELFQLVDVEKREKILLNFSAVEFLGSATLGKLITLEKRARNAGAKIKLSNIRPAIFDVFKITNFDRVFDIYPDEADALAAF